MPAGNVSRPSIVSLLSGVYDHVFLEHIEEEIKSLEHPTFHFIYTTSNHGPYKMEDSLLDYDPCLLYTSRCV